MRRPLALLVLALALAACAPSSEYKKQKQDEHRMQLDAYNCEYEQTHRRLPDGSYQMVEVEEEQLKTLVKQCLERKGYHLTENSKETTEHAWWWPF